MSINSIAHDLHLLYLESKLKEYQALFKAQMDADMPANVSLRLINEFQYQIDQHNNGESATKMLRQCLLAIESGVEKSTKLGLTYKQTFGIAFVERIKKALNKV